MNVWPGSESVLLPSTCPKGDFVPSLLEPVKTFMFALAGKEFPFSSLLIGFSRLLSHRSWLFWASMVLPSERTMRHPLPLIWGFVLVLSLAFMLLVEPRAFHEASLMRGIALDAASWDTKLL